MSQLKQQSDEDSGREGGMFYPKGYIVTAHIDAAAAQGALKTLVSGGYPAADITLVSAADMLNQASRNLDNPGLLAAIGGSLASRQQQYRLAKEGCSFLLINAAEDEQEALAVKLLASTAVHYATKYRTLVIENLMPLIPSTAVTDAESTPTPPR